MKQKKLRLTSITSKKVTDVSTWHKAFEDAQRKEDFALIDQTPPAAVPGYIVTLKGFHFYNHKDTAFDEKDRRFVEKYFIENLRKWVINAGGVEVPVGKIGITHPIVAWSIPSEVQYDPNQGTSSGFGGGMGGMSGMSGMGGGMMPGGLGGGDMLSGGESGGMAGLGGPGGGYGSAPPLPGGGAGMPSGGGIAGPSSGGGMPGMPGMPGGGMLGGPPGRMGGPPGGSGAAGQNQVSGAQGPIFEQKQQQAIQTLTRTDFVVQFVWVPSPNEKKRPAADPRTPPADAAAANGTAPATTP